MNITEEKEKIRHQVREQLKNQSPQIRELKSEAILKRLALDPDFQKSKTVMFYVSADREVDTAALLKDSLQSGRTVLVPFVDHPNTRIIPVRIHDWAKELIPGSYGILEPRPDLAKPFDADKIDFVLVPGLAFDRSGNRIGRGKGYYDRFLSTLSPRAKRYGLAFDFQLFESIPSASNDVSMDRVITNEK